MNKQKQIEEMARSLTACPRNSCVGCGMDCVDYRMAKAIFEAGYRKIPEGAVVLTEKEYKRYERIEKIIKLAKMEKANGYEVKNGKLYYFSNMLDGCEIEFKDLQEICDMANHYNEEFWGLEQRLTFWQAKAEETRKETVEKIYKGLCKKWGKMKNCILVGNESEDLKDLIVEICKEITEGKV